MRKTTDETLVGRYKDTPFDELLDNYIAADDYVQLNPCLSYDHHQIECDLYEIGKALFGERWVNDPEVQEVRSCKS
jgi:hypothetical protein